MDEKPKGHGDWAKLIRDEWSDSELLRAADEILELERSPGYARLCALLDAREQMLVDRVVIDKPGDVRSTDQILGSVLGLRQARMAIDSIIHEANQARERAKRAAAEADAAQRGAPA